MKPEGDGVAALARLGIVAVMLGDGKIGWRGTRGSGEWLFESRRAIPADGDALLPVGVHALLDDCSGLPLTESLDDGSGLAMVCLRRTQMDASAQKSVKPKKKLQNACEPLGKNESAYRDAKCGGK